MPRNQHGETVGEVERKLAEHCVTEARKQPVTFTLRLIIDVAHQVDHRHRSRAAVEMGGEGILVEKNFQRPVAREFRLYLHALQQRLRPLIQRLRIREQGGDRVFRAVFGHGNKRKFWHRQTVDPRRAYGQLGRGVTNLLRFCPQL